MLKKKSPTKKMFKGTLSNIPKDHRKMMEHFKNKEDIEQTRANLMAAHKMADSATGSLAEQVASELQNLKPYTKGYPAFYASTDIGYSVLKEVEIRLHTGSSHNIRNVSQINNDGTMLILSIYDEGHESILQYPLMNIASIVIENQDN